MTSVFTDAQMKMMEAAIVSQWNWYGGYNDEVCVYGPCESKEDIIAEAVDDRTGEFQDDSGSWKIGIHISEARNDPLRMADWIDADHLLNRAEEAIYESDRVCGDYDDGIVFECTPGQELDLQKRIKAACDEWQEAHGLVFTVRTFSHIRNHEYVVVDAPAIEVA